MGNTNSHRHCWGPKIDNMLICPTLPTMDKSRALESESEKLQMLTLSLVGSAAKFVHTVGPAISSLLSIVESLTFKDMNGHIDSSILGNNLIHYDSEIAQIKMALERINLPGLGEGKIQSEMSYALHRSKYLFDIFKDESSLLHRYPFVTMPHLIRVINILWATIQLTSRLDPTFKPGNDRVLQEMSEVGSKYVRRFLDIRVKDIYDVMGSRDNRGTNETSKERVWHIVDRPWTKEYDIWFGVDNGWDDAMRITRARYGISCTSYVKDYHKLQYGFDDAEDYKRMLRDGYGDYFRKAFPVPIYI